MIAADKRTKKKTKHTKKLFASEQNEMEYAFYSNFGRRREIFSLFIYFGFVPYKFSSIAAVVVVLFNCVEYSTEAQDLV